MKRIVFSAALVVMMTGLVYAQSDLQPIANVKLQKSEPITIKQLKARVEAYQKEMGRSMSLDERKKVLDTLINERLVVQAAEKDGLKISDAEVNQNFTQMVSQQVGKTVTEAEFAQIIKDQTGMSLDDFMKQQNGMSLSEYKGFLKNQLLAQRYVVMKRQSDLQNIPGPSDAEIRSNYELYKQNFVQPDMVKLFLVVVPKGDNPADSKDKLSDMQKQLKDKSASPSELKVRSQAANSGFQAGDLYINKNATASQQLGISMEALLKIFSMGVNDVSDISETAKDFQCFLIQEKYPAKILDLSDVVKPGTTVTVYEYIKNNLMSQSQNNAVSQALTQIINDLRKPENYQILKTDAELEKALTW
jgi:parvulin-like peptidyl-prolyl isomerase